MSTPTLSWELLQFLLISVQSHSLPNYDLAYKAFMEFLDSCLYSMQPSKLIPQHDDLSVSFIDKLFYCSSFSLISPNYIIMLILHFFNWFSLHPASRSQIYLICFRNSILSYYQFLLYTASTWLHTVHLSYLEAYISYSVHLFCQLTAPSFAEFLAICCYQIFLHQY